MRQRCDYLVQGHRAGKWQAWSCLADSMVGLVVQSPVQVLSNMQKRGEEAMLGWGTPGKCKVMPKAGLAHQGHGR